MNDQTDQQLLRAYADHKSEAAFAAIVHRYLDLVYSASFRMVNEAHAAKDITQSVFVLLARNARQLTDRPALAGWLHCTARNLAAKTVRSEVRRRAREQEAAIMNDLLSANPEISWEHIAPHLDEALGELDETDRDAVLLRYFKNHDLRIVGATLGISDDAAQKRVSRAVERLREFFAKRGVTVGASGLAVVISAHAVQAAPVGLALTISTAAVLTGTTLATTATITATKAIAMTAIQKTIVAVTIAVLAGAGIYEARQAAQLRDQVQALQQQQTPLAEQIRQLQSERGAATKQIAALREDNERLNRNTTELLKLRGEVTRLRNQAELRQQQLAKADASNRAPLDKAPQKSGEVRLKELLEQMPEHKIPELNLLNDKDYLVAASDGDLNKNEDIRNALSRLRLRAENLFAIKLQLALQQYSKATQQTTPPTLSALANYFDPPTDAAILERYEVVNTGTDTIAGWNGGWVVAQKNAVDSERDHRWSVSPVGFSWLQLRWPTQESVNVPKQKLSGANQ